MKYKPLPLNVASICFICFGIYALIYPGPEGWGVLILIIGFPFAVAGWIIDFCLQKFITKYWQLFIIESLLIGCFVLFDAYGDRTKTLIIPNQLPNKYVVVVYGVSGAPKLPAGAFCWSYEVKIPESGVLL